MFADRKLNTIVSFLDETFEELAYDITTTVLEAVELIAGIIKLQVKQLVQLLSAWRGDDGIGSVGSNGAGKCTADSGGCWRPGQGTYGPGWGYGGAGMTV